MKSEKIQAAKQVIVVEKASGKAYSGHGARSLIGLPNVEARARPESNPMYDIFIESNSINRKLVPGTRLLVLQ